MVQCTDSSSRKLIILKLKKWVELFKGAVQRVLWMSYAKHLGYILLQVLNYWVCFFFAVSFSVCFGLSFSCEGLLLDLGQKVLFL